jgi:hypothetical protein
MFKKRWVLVLVLLVLITSLGHQDRHAIVHLFALLAGLALFPFAILAIVGVGALPFTQSIGLWVLWRWLRDGQLPPSMRRVAGWARTRHPHRYRLRVERVPAPGPSAPDAPAPAE